jgi:hypothetical protein
MSTHVEWCAWWGGEDPNECAGLLAYGEEAEAREMASWIKGGRVAHRTVAVRPWLDAEPWPPAPNREDQP